MINISGGNVDVKSLEMKDIMDISALQKFLDDFAIGMNCAAVAVDINGNEVTKPSDYRPFCQDFIHKSAVGDARCAECHKRFGEEAAKSGKPYIGQCHAGMVDFATPVMIDGIQIGTILGGQILEKEPDEMKIRTVASEINVDPDQLVEAAHKADIVPAKSIAAAADVLFIVVNELARTGYNRIETQALVENMSDSFKQISETIDNLAQSAQTITENQDALSTEIGGIETTARDIAKGVEVVEDLKRKTPQSKNLNF